MPTAACPLLGIYTSVQNLDRDTERALCPPESFRGARSALASRRNGATFGSPHHPSTTTNGERTERLFLTTVHRRRHGVYNVSDAARPILFWNARGGDKFKVSVKLGRQLRGKRSTLQSPPFAFKLSPA